MSGRFSHLKIDFLRKGKRLAAERKRQKQVQDELNRRLFEAAAEGDADAVGELLEQGADVNAVSACGATPLHWAALHGQTAAVLALIAQGADVNARDKDGRTPLHWAESRGRPRRRRAPVRAWP